MVKLEIKIGRQWERFDAAAHDLALAAWRKGRAQFKYQARGSEYVVDFLSIEQLNTRTGKVCSLRIREDADASSARPDSQPRPASRGSRGTSAGSTRARPPALYAPPAGAPKGVLPATPAERCVRIVCISDTHCEHDALALPDGDILIHAGDCLTESGLRHAKRTRDGIQVNSAGEALLEQFAVWFGSLPFLHKVLVGGNHDLVLQGLGPENVRALFARHCTFGTVHYLEHETAQVGPFTIFGSPYGLWGSHNDAFACPRDLPEFDGGADVVVTHSPCVLPRRASGGQKEDARVAALVRGSGAQLHVGGHCHWAHGVYTLPSDAGDVRCVVASVCGDWEMPYKLVGATRLDAADWRRGGYSAANPPIVCDLRTSADISEFEDARLAPRTKVEGALSTSPKPSDCFLG